MQIKNKKSGYTLVEMVIYVAVMSIVFLLIVNTVLSFTKSYKGIYVLRIVDGSAVDAMERMTREIRGATSVDTVNSTFGSNPGVLTLVSVSSSNSTTTKFYLDNGVLKVDINGVYSGPLSGVGVSVDSLIFTKLDSGISTAIKIDMIVRGTAGQTTRTKNYHTTILLKIFN
ncbi:MAG: hypothetical protein AB201_00295 [Parcubacteria bacterium C7867-006]|nr:MAG: hypothetical protein AB201_00295 [Parcubacteria bacterium C7867-006]